MSKIISGQELRERLRGRLEAARTAAPETWVQALAGQGNRDLLSLIAIRRPRSIGELAEAAGRAQPNVSRSLTSLVDAGLIEVRQSGRASIPTLTALGREKAAELGLDDRRVMEPAVTPEDVSSGEARPFLSVSFDAHAATGEDVLAGAVLARMSEVGRDEPTVARSVGDVNAFAIWMLDHWWRLLYRRDAPLKIADTAFTAVDSDRRFSIVFKCAGSRIERSARTSEGQFVQLDKSTHLIAVADCERDLLDWIVRPVAGRMRSSGRLDRPVQAKLARLEDTYVHKAELIFARTAGALGSSAYDLGDTQAESVRRLVEMIPDEGARLDFASAVLTEEVDAASRWVRTETACHADRNRLPRLVDLSRALRPLLEDWLWPHRRGTRMARLVRQRLDLASDVGFATGSDLAALFGGGDFKPSSAAPGALRAFQSLAGDVPTAVVEDEGPEATKFTLARAIGDYLVFQSATSCVADLYTDRQAVGRAFAAEFIAPAEGVVRMIEDEGEPITRVARHYGTTPTVIRHQWENNKDRFVEA